MQTTFESLESSKVGSCVRGLENDVNQFLTTLGDLGMVDNTIAIFAADDCADT